MLAEPTPRTTVENIGYFVMNGATQENGNLMLKGPNSPMACRLQDIKVKSQNDKGWGFQSCWDLIVRREERVMKHFFRS